MLIDQLKFQELIGVVHENAPIEEHFKNLFRNITIRDKPFIDVDLYEPTIGCLEYFVPRMVKGGCILNDDFASPMFPGGFTGWRDFCDRRGLPYAILDSGQSVLICE